jgi:tetratricopeptide (TPR) repeat protein
MYQHERTNRIIGWSLAGLALVIYMLTTAPTVAFWDNGEFIAVGDILGVGHPPGSPVYTLITRLFSFLPFPNVARAINFESVLAGALAIAFLYFSIAKMAKRWEGTVRSFSEGLSTYVAGVTACVFAAFSFSFWENSLEAEVYATNIFTMTFTLWLVLWWSELKEVPRDRKIIYLVGYLLALGIGTHMGCLLWAPGYLVFIILFERSFLGTVLLAVPFGLGFSLFSKDIQWGAWGLLAGLWLPVTVYYALPRLWPEPVKPKRKRKGQRLAHPATMPTALTLTIAAVEIVFLFATAANHGASGAWWFIGYGIASAGALALFVRLLRDGYIEHPEIPARVVLGVIVLGGIALSVHAYLLIRARLDPAINESDPRTWSLVLDVMRRKQYEPMRFFPRRTPFSNQFRILWSYYRPQFTIWPLFLAVWGAIAHARKDRRTFALMAIGFFLTSVGLLFYMNLSDHEVRTREYFWVPSYVGLALWMGIGSAAIVDWARQLGVTWRRTLAAMLVAFSFLPLIRHYHEMDRSKNWVAYYYGKNLLNYVDENAILITNGDNDTFPLWYLQQVEGMRPDVDILNLSLVQINWYIKQLKDRGIPMSFTYDEIEHMTPYWVRDPDTGQTRMITLRDIAVHDIIRETGTSRPIYWAVTVDDFMGYWDRLKLEGMVFKLVPETGRSQIDVERTRENVFVNYEYESIVDKEDGWRVMSEIYKPPATTRLITNYAAGFSRLGFHAMQQARPDVDEAIRLYNIALKFAPNYGPALNGLIAIYAARLFEPEKALPLAEQLLADQPENVETWIRYAGVNLMVAEQLERDGQADEAMPHFRVAMQYYEQALRREPTRTELYPALLSIYQRLGYEQKVNNLIDVWGRYAPDDLRSMLGRARDAQPEEGEGGSP